MAFTLSEYERSLFELADILRSAGFHFQQIDPEASLECRNLLKRIAEHRFNVVVAGRFNRGKSTLLNAILGSEYLPTGIVPLTSVITAVRFGNRERAVLHYESSGLPRHVPLTDLPRYITEEGNPGNQRKIRIAQLEVPSEILRHDYFFVDTPGLASAILENTRTTEEFLPEIDALILVTSYEGPLSQDEIVFLEKAIGTGVRRIFLIINKSDLVTSEEREQALRFVHEKCAQMGLGAIPILSASAREGLAARKSGDRESLARGGILQIEERLVSFVTHDKSSVFLARLVDRTMAVLNGSDRGVRVENLLSRVRCLAQQLFSNSTGTPQAPTEQSPALPVHTPVTPRPCQVCAEILRQVLDHLATFQLAVSTDENTRLRHVRSRGLCAFHTWQYEHMASPIGVCTGYFPLLHSLCEDFELIADSDLTIEEVRKRVLSNIGTRSRCSACAIRAAAEGDALNKVISALKSESRSRPPAVCLPHLAGVVMRIDDTKTAKQLLASQAALLRRVAEEMQRYALRQESLRRDLITEEEELSYRFALQYLTGNKHVDALWFLDYHEADRN